MKQLVFAAALLAASMTACNNDVDSAQEMSESSLLQVRSYMTSENHSRGIGFEGKTEFKSGDAMGLFIYKDKNFGTTYPSTPTPKVNTQSTCKGTSGWKQEPAVYLTADKGTVWAYAPYNASVSDGTQIPVDVTSNNVDYLYGNSGLVSVVDPLAIIPMKHALSQFVIRLHRSPAYHGKGILQKIELKTAHGKFAQTGTLNVTNGKITATPALASLAWTPNNKISTDGDVDYCASIFPCEVGSNEVTLEVTIDNAKWKYVIPAINWTAGNRYIYGITMKADDAEIGGADGSQITIEPWKTNDKGDINLVPMK